jgi:hypothetical protein
VTDVLACAEAMWAWIVDLQTREKRRREHHGTWSVDADANSDVDGDAKTSLVEMTHPDLDALLMRYDLCVFFFFTSPQMCVADECGRAETCEP